MLLRVCRRVGGEGSCVGPSLEEANGARSEGKDRNPQLPSPGCAVPSLHPGANRRGARSSDCELRGEEDGHDAGQIGTSRGPRQEPESARLGFVSAAVNHNRRTPPRVCVELSPVIKKGSKTAQAGWCSWPQ
eukprot:1607522-Rhodomonas_salina.1